MPPTMKRHDMNRVHLFVAAALLAGAAFGHEGHGATPAHLHPSTGGFPIDIGAIVIVGFVVVVGLAVAAHRRHLR
jgi:hypothetical protein